MILNENSFYECICRREEKRVEEERHREGGYIGQSNHCLI